MPATAAFLAGWCAEVPAKSKAATASRYDRSDAAVRPRPRWTCPMSANVVAMSQMQRWASSRRSWGVMGVSLWAVEVYTKSVSWREGRDDDCAAAAAAAVATDAGDGGREGLLLLDDDEVHSKHL
eukprot:CAMPEP_0197722792 /NCGR_PEP_ID=MMETSP1434-20131217/5359_1 /TAXON_ID=265543 /ORGANISM="Minutocellus polymorphus, Strain CCMP3303" /LENGTH=124 /DNA_ID=CAMNT_0043307985 /DNA_START=87 /DNA_END=457 /DNA_ORIENTATION=-